MCPGSNKHYCVPGQLREILYIHMLHNPLPMQVSMQMSTVVSSFLSQQTSADGWQCRVCLTDVHMGDAVAKAFVIGLTI